MLLIQIHNEMLAGILIPALLAVTFGVAWWSSYNKMRRLKENYKAVTEELAEKQNTLEQVKMKAEESDKLKSSFLANMSHEIRTPLNAIMGFSSLMQQSDNLDQESREYMEIIHKNSNKLLDVMDEIFNIALIESGITKMYAEKCHVNELITSLVAFFNIEKEMTEKSNVTIRTKKLSRDNAFVVETDQRKLRQTLYNLIENALKYTNEGHIEVGYDIVGNNLVQFYVKDTGIGFPQAKLDIIFQRFRQVDDSNTRTFGGLGLGLTLSQKFVEIIGGQMWGESKPGAGSTFYFTLPINTAKFEVLEDVDK